MISLKIWETLLSCQGKCFLPVTVRVLKTRVLNKLEGLRSRRCQPELKLHKFFALRMSNGRHALSRRAPRYFSHSCRFASTLRISEHFFSKEKRKHHAQTHAKFLKSWLCPNFSCCPNVTDAMRVEEVANSKNRDRNAGQFKQNLIAT